MKFMVIVKEDQQSEAGVLPDPEIFEKMSAYNQRLLDAGVMLTAEGLLPSSKGICVKFEGDKRAVIDGPSRRPRNWSAASGFSSAPPATKCWTG